MKLPNILTVSRFGLAAVLMICLSPSCSFPKAPFAALIIFVVASLTDALDGHLARKTYGVSSFGKLMDPLADKVLTTVAFIGFVGLQVMPAWMVTLIITREMMVTGLRLLAIDKGIILSASMWGKQKTIWQMTFIIGVLLAAAIPYGEGLLLDKLGALVWWVGLAVTVLTVWSGIVYFRQNRSLLDI